jgi:hypothetical protein
MNEELDADSPMPSKPNKDKSEITDDAVKRTELPYTRSVAMNTQQKKEKNEWRVLGSLTTTERYRRLA